MLTLNQMLLLKGLIRAGMATSYRLYQDLKGESLPIKIASVSVVYPILDSLIKLGYVEIAEQKTHGKQERKKYKVNGAGEKALNESELAYQQVIDFKPQPAY